MDTWLSDTINKAEKKRRKKRRKKRKNRDIDQNGK